MMALIDTKIGHKFTCKKPEQYDIMPRDVSLTVVSVNHSEGVIRLGDSPFKNEWETINRSKMDEVEAYIKDGYNYQSRTLFTGDSIAKELEDIQRYTDKVIVKERIEKLILTLKG